MAKAGETKAVGTTSTGTTKDFAGSGVEGQKDPAGDPAPPADDPAPPADDPAPPADDPAPPADDPHAAPPGLFGEDDDEFDSDIDDVEGATSVVTMRDGAPKRIWFRDGKEIGSEDV